MSRVRKWGARLGGKSGGAGGRRFRWPLKLALLVLAGSLAGCRQNIPLQPFIAYVVKHDSGTLAAVNLANFQVTGSLPVVPQPEKVVLRPGSHQLYVVSASGKIGVVSFPKLRLLTTLDLGESAKDLAFSPDGRAAYLLDPQGHNMYFLDCTGGPVISADEATPKVAARLHLGGTLADLALSPDGKMLVVSTQDPDQIVLVGAEDRQVLGTVEVGQKPGPMVILPDNSKVFVADQGEDKISVADLVSRRLLSHIEIGTPPTSLLLKQDGGELFVLAAQSSTLVILDAFHDNVEQTFPLGRDPVAGIFRKDMSIIYIANEGDGSVLSLDVQTRTVLASTHVGMKPRALALTPDPDQRLLVVADSAASSLAVLHADPTSLSSARSVLITTITVGGSPVDVVIPELLSTSPTR